jgi:twitching motility protein PilU
LDLNALLLLMAKKQASDLFITVNKPPCLKIDGQIYPVTAPALGEQETRKLVAAAMNDEQQKRFAAERECNFALQHKDIGRFRVSAFVQKDEPGMVLRLIKTRIPTIEELNLPQILKQLAMIKRGLVLFAGATGTGKSSSLAAMIGYRNREQAGHIVSIEDPIEFVHEHDKAIITQREIGIDTDSYETALSNTLRQAPDVILIGEIRTREVMDHAIAFAETGHLCLSTVHANTAPTTLDRIINFFPEDRRDQLLLDLSLNLRAVVSQQLLRRADGSGRVPVVEVLLNTPLVADHIRKGDIDTLRDIMKRSTEQGMTTFDKGLYQLYTKGLITYEDALKYAVSENEVRLMVKLGESGQLDRLSHDDFQDIQLLRDD